MTADELIATLLLLGFKRYTESNYELRSVYNTLEIDVYLHCGRPPDWTQCNVFVGGVLEGGLVSLEQGYAIIREHYQLLEASDDGQC